MKTFEMPVEGLMMYDLEKERIKQLAKNYSNDSKSKSIIDAIKSKNSVKVRILRKYNRNSK